MLAATVAACSWLSHLLWRAGRAIRDRRTPPPRPLAEVIDELRAGMAAVAAGPDPAGSEADLAAGRYLEIAHVWLDEAGIEAEPAARGG